MSPSAEIKRLMSAITTVGPVEITLDKDLDPLSIDNIETIKPRLKAALTATGDAQADAAGITLYDAFIAKLAQQSAKTFTLVMQINQTGVKSAYNRPLPLHTPIPLSGDPDQPLGESLRQTGTVTLDDWTDGQSAKLTTVLTPLESDLHTTMTGLAKTMLSRLANTEQPQFQSLMDRMLDNMHFSTTLTCHTQIDLGNFAVTQMTCDRAWTLTIDVAKALPPEVLTAKPQLAQAPPMTLKGTDHLVEETHLVP